MRLLAGRFFIRHHLTVLSIRTSEGRGPPLPSDLSPPVCHAGNSQRVLADGISPECTSSLAGVAASDCHGTASRQLLCRFRDALPRGLGVRSSFFVGAEE